MKILKILETVKNFIKKNKKLVTVVSAMFCAVVLVAGSIAGTIAYLTSEKSITNTFTVGKVGITLDESPVDTDGKKTTGDRVATNSYKLFPGKTYDKDPIIHVDADSEACWLFVKIENNIDGIEVAEDDGDTIAEQLAARQWTLVSGETNVYCRAVTNAANDNVSVFATFTVADDVDNTTLASYAGQTIVVTAYAVQADGFGTAQAAWDATFGA